MQADGLADLGMFYQCSLPSMSLTTQDFKVWDDQSKPNPLPVGVQATFGDVTLSRGVDAQGELYNWISKIAQKGATPDTVKDVTLLACNAEGDPVQTWLLKTAYPSSYQASGLAAAGTDVLHGVRLDPLHGGAARRQGRPHRHDRLGDQAGRS